MVKHFCDICNKVLNSSDTDKPTEIYWYKLSKMNCDYYRGKYEEASAEICNDCLKAIVDKAKRKLRKI